MYTSRDFHPGDLVWFDPGVGYVLPGEILEFHKAAQVITVQAVINNVVKTFTLNNLSSVKSRQDLGVNGVDDMISLSDLNEASILWNLRIRYDNNHIYTYIGSILVAINPYRMFDFYGLDAVSKYDGKLMGSLPPHLFAVGASAYHRLLAKDGENQVILITGESGAGKTESTKLLLQYLSAVNKSSSNLITEQILEASPLLESFGNAKTVRNDNSSRFGKYLEILYKDGIISGCKITDYLLEKSRIVSHAPEERNYHVFYELINGLDQQQREGLGLMTPEKYFYLNQGGSCHIDGKNDKEDFESLLSALQVLGFTSEERDTVFKILASILHLGNVYFHRKQLRYGQEGVEIGSDVEIKWTAHLLQLNVHAISKTLVMKTSEMRNEMLKVPLNIDQALDARDAIAKALYSSLFTWLVARLNKICSGRSRRHRHTQNLRKNVISMLDMFGFEDFPENSFEQLCINFANENLQHFFIKNVFKIEQNEYVKEKLEWTPIQFNDNNQMLHILAKKPVGIFHLLDDESNFPKATDVSFLEKCHYNHALNELYSRPRMTSMEFGIKHYAGQVWYNVEGFLDKNRDTLRHDMMGLLISSKDKMISKMFLDLRNFQEATRTMNLQNSMMNNRQASGHFITMKPRTPTVAARFHDALNQLLHTVAQCNPFYIRCIKPNNDKCPMKFDMPVVLEQLRHTGMLETIRIRKLGYPIRMKYLTFAQRYRCLLQGMIPRGAPTKEVARVILDREDRKKDLYALGGSKVFMREELEQKLEKERNAIMEVEVLKVQRYVRGYLARKQYKAKKHKATKIQAAYRGYKVRREYTKVKKGVVALQAQYRRKKQQSLYEEMKVELKQRAELEAKFRAEQKSRKRGSEEKLEVNSLAKTPTSSSRASPMRTSASVASVNQLEVPAELAFLMSKSDSWQPINTEKNLARVTGEVARNKKEKMKLPNDLDYHVFSKVANIYFKSHLWQMKRDPIKTPFLSKSKDSDYQESLAIFKLILRFMNDDKLGGKKEKLLSDYIINKGIQNEKLRDEIFCQLANQTWKNENEENCERGWFLLSNCLSSFPPSKMLYKYLLKYVSDHGHNGYKSVCQHKLLKSGKISSQHFARQYPPTTLEWRANKKRVQMALEVKCSDRYERHAHVDSFTTAEEIASYVLGERNVPELNGWTVAMEEGDACIELNGGDFVLDAIGEMELHPSFPAQKSSFIVTYDRSRGQLPLIINTGPHNNPKYRYGSASPENAISRKQRARSQDRLLAESADQGLSKSALNERYFEEKSTAKSRSLDNLLGNEQKNFGLSESRLNKRYRDMNNLTNHDFLSPEDLELESISQRGGRQDKWDEMGLSKTPINERYFSSQPDLDKSGNKEEENKDRSRSVNRMEEFDYQETGPSVMKSRLHGNPRYVKGQRKGGRYDKSSALSDTSEAPSIASHVRGVRVPSQASDVDQFLDDLFMPVLDGNIDDGLSDAKSLAASMKGGYDQDDSDIDEELERTRVERQNSLKRKSVLSDLELLSTALKGGKDSPDEETPKKQQQNSSDFTPTHSSMGFQPIPGVISPTPMGGMMSPPPMLMPTPVHSMTGNPNPQSLMMQSPSGEPHPAMAFTYVPIPVYNMGGMSIPGMQGMMPPGMVSPSPPKSESPTKAKSSTPNDERPRSKAEQVEQAQMAYQQAYLQNAVAQNMQIQQQLMMQNQALTQLLSQSNNSANVTPTTMPSMVMNPPSMFQGSLNTTTTSQGGASQYGMTEEQRRASMQQLLESRGFDTSAGLHEQGFDMKQKSKSFPNTPKTSTVQPPEGHLLSGVAMDPYTRARTIRIGKWRWPPPKDESAPQEEMEGFFEFKMRKLHERRLAKEQEGREMKKSRNHDGRQTPEEDYDQDFDAKADFDDEDDGIDWTAEYEKELELRSRRSQSRDSFDEFDHLEQEKMIQMRHMSQSPTGGSIGKLKISNEMKEKLEAVTGSRKNSVRSTTRKSSESETDGDNKENKINKLDESRKQLLEQKLGRGKLKKWDTVEQVHRHEQQAINTEIPQAPNRKTSRPGEIPLPPPPPPTHPLVMKMGVAKSKKEEIKKKKRKDSGSSSSSSSSSAYSPDGSLPRPHNEAPPAPIKPDASFMKQGYSDRRQSMETDRTSATEKFEIEESSEFLQPVDSYPRLKDNEDDYQTLERIKTALHPPHSATHFSYNRVPWNLKIRKEMFSPTETVSSPTAINLIFCQIVADVFSPLCIRLTTSERSRMKTLFDEYDIDLKNVYSPKHKLSTKKNIIDMAKEFSVYFSRIYPISSGNGNKPGTDTSQFLAISHSGVRMVKRQKSLPTDYLQVLETYNYEDIGEVSTIKHNGLQMVMHQGGRVIVTTDKAAQVKDLLNQYILESNSGQFDYVKALADFNFRDESTLNFKKGDIIAVVPKRDAYTEKGWLYGIKDGQYGLFPSDFVERMSPQAIKREMKVIAKVTQRSHNKNSEEDEDESEDSFLADEKNVEPDYSGQDEIDWELNQRRLPKSANDDSDNFNKNNVDDLSEISESAAKVNNDGKNPLLEFAMSYFREREKFDLLESSGTEDAKNKKNKKKKKKDKKNSTASSGKEASGDWTWKDQVDMVKWTDQMINNSLLRLEPSDINKMALECFACIMRYMGDLPLLKNQHEVDCVNTILMYCHKFDVIRDEVYCQIMKQTTNNKSAVRDSCQKGWRLFSIIGAYFTCSDLLHPFLFKYLENSAYDKRRAYHGTALVCLHNLRKTFKYGGRKNVPSIEEITAISAGRSSKRQIYRLPGGTERVINTKSTTVVENIIEELCNVIGVDNSNEREEFSLYCIVEGETFTVPLAKEHYILDVTTELQRDGAVYYLIFCRSVWYYPLRLDNQLYIEVVFNQIAPDYLEGLLLVMPGEQIEQDFVFDISKVAALLHRAADMDHKPTIKETKFLLPKPALSAREIKPPQWVNMVQNSWEDVKEISSSQAKAKVLETLSAWPLFGSSFFAVRREAEPKEGSEHILALNKNGVSFLDLITHETLLHYPFTEVISTRKVQIEDGTLFLDMKCGNLMQQRITRIQTEQANEIARLIKQYITIDQRLRGTAKPPEVESSEKRNTPSR